MNAQKISMLMALMLIAIVPRGFSLVPDTNDKPVEMVVEFYPNYAGHLLGVAEIGYQSSYAEKYQSAIKPIDLEYLRANGELLRWELGDEGPLTCVFVTFPGYINPDTKEELAEYLLDLNTAVALKSFDSFYQKYYQTIKDLDSWCGFSVNSYIYKYESEIQRISQILMNNFDSFKYWVWPNTYSEIKTMANSLNYQLSKIDLIKQWEDITGIEFQADSYQVALSTGMANGPTGKSLGYEKEWCYYGEHQKDLVQRVCQDAGRRLLVNVCCNKYKEYDPLLCYKVYESLNKYLSNMILDKVGWSGREDSELPGQDEIFAIFDSIFRISPDIKATDLYGIALDNYSKVYAFTNQ